VMKSSTSISNGSRSSSLAEKYPGRFFLGEEEISSTSFILAVSLFGGGGNNNGALSSSNIAKTSLPLGRREPSVDLQLPAGLAVLILDEPPAADPGRKLGKIHTSSETSPAGPLTREEDLL